ncbi:L-asparaginase II [compost metagenome]
MQGLVVAATGNGTLHHALEAALQRAMRAGVPVWLGTRCSEGQLVGSPETASTEALQPRPVTLSPVKARISLQLALLTQR